VREIKMKKKNHKKDWLLENYQVVEENTIKHNGKAFGLG
jgi:hypothetical protein